MNTKEFSELRRRMRRDRSNITTIYGCYVNCEGNVISDFSTGIGTMPEAETEKYLAIFKRCLTGKIGKSLINVDMPTNIVESDQHKLMMKLRKDYLSDSDDRKKLYSAIIKNVKCDSNYVILLAEDTYDVPFKTKDDLSRDESQNDEYVYVIGCICPVKNTKSNLHYEAEEAVFHDGGILQAISAPSAGFLFPAFDDRRANIYGAAFYRKYTERLGEIKTDGIAPLANAVFGVTTSENAEERRATFVSLLKSALGEECTGSLIQGIHQEAVDLQQLHKEGKATEPLTVSPEKISDMLIHNGLSEETAEKFKAECTEALGDEIQLDTILDEKRFVVQSGSVTIRLDPHKTDILDIKTVDGVRYITICVDENVEINGITIP